MTVRPHVSDRRGVHPSLAVRALIVVGLALAVAFALRAPARWGESSADELFGTWVYDGVAMIGMVLCVWRAIRVRLDRVVWSMIALALVLQVSGNTLYGLMYDDSALNVPFPSVSDGLWLACYLPLITALVLRIRGLPSIGAETREFG